MYLLRAHLQLKSIYLSLPDTFQKNSSKVARFCRLIAMVIVLSSIFATSLSIGIQSSAKKLIQMSKGGNQEGRACRFRVRDRVTDRVKQMGMEVRVGLTGFRVGVGVRGRV